MTRVASILRTPASAVWILLVVVTVASWKLGSGHAVGDVASGIAVLVLSLVKVRFVGLYFMDLKEAGRNLRTAFEVWCGVVCTGLVVMYLAG